MTSHTSMSAAATSAQTRAITEVGPGGITRHE
jgi:hypothetical protein